MEANLGCRVWGLGVLEFRVQGVRVQGFRVWAVLGFRISGFSWNH